MRIPGPPNQRAFVVTAVFALVIEGLVALAFAWCMPVVVASSQEKSALLTLIAADYNRTAPRSGVRCVEIKIVRKASGETEQALALDWDRSIDGEEPVVWSPASTTWIALLKANRASLGASDLVRSTPPSIAQSQLVIAMPRPMGEALGWPSASVGWSEILALARDPAGWGSRGHPDWGGVLIGKTNPNISTSGLHALIGAYFAAAGRPPTDADLSDSRVRQFVADVEASVAHYGDAVSRFLDNLLDADRRREALSYVSAIAMEEKQVLDYNDGNPHSDVTNVPRIPPRIPLIAIYPKDATVVANHPYAILDAPWVDDAERDAAEAFQTYLLSPAVQQRFLDAGFRDHTGAPGPRHKESNGVLPQVTGLALTLSGPVIEKIQRSWQDLRKRVRVLIAIDASAPMKESLPGGGVTRMDAAKQAASAALEELAPDDDVGIWIFGAGVSTTAPYRELAPMAPLGTRRQDLHALINSITVAGGDTPLYSTTRAAVDHVARGYDPKKIDGVMLLTSGRNLDRDDDLQRLLRGLELQRPDRRVRVFGLTYGTDTNAVNSIAIASGGSAYAAENAAAIREAIKDLISNF